MADFIQFIWIVYNIVHRLWEALSPNSLVYNALKLYSVGAGFEHWSGHGLSWLRLRMVLLSPSNQMLR
jgi:hypothetical protein